MMQMRLLTVLGCALAFVGMLSSGTIAAEDGQTIAQQVYDRDAGRNAYAEIEMILIDKQGGERTRSLTSALKYYGPRSKRYIRFTAPATIKDTAFLSWENSDRADDQFLFLPAVGRVRRIASNQKDQSFVNSDFTYEDLEKRKVTQDTHRVLRHETHQQFTCWVLESVPRESGSSQYSRVVSWVDQQSLVPVKVEYYDKRERLAKILLVHRVEQVDNIWTALEVDMQDVSRQQRTLLRVRTIRYDHELPDHLFTEHYLQNPS